MKNILIFALLLCSLSAFSQEIVTDTSYLNNVSGNFFEVRRTVYANGAYTETSSLVGDTSAMLSIYVNRIASEADAIAQAAAIAYTIRKKSNDWTRLDTVVTQRLYRSPITAIADSYERELLAGNWQIEFSGTTTGVTFPRLSTNKRIRMLPATGGTPRTMLLYGKGMRIVNYPFSGTNLLFQLRDGYWINLDFGDPAKRIVLRRVSN